MTLGANRAAHADHDIIFSAELRRNAKSLELTEHMGVGEWDYGQGIRRAHGPKFFWEMRQQNFLPLGLHHPLVLAASKEKAMLAPQSFPAELLKLYPSLKEWQWSVLSLDHPWMKKVWSSSTAWKNAVGENLQEDATFKTQAGWQGFSQIGQIHNWSVVMSDGHAWVASSSALPESSGAPDAIVKSMRVLLSLDVLGPQGRIAELHMLLKSNFPHAQLEGLNLQIKHTDVSLTSRGLAYDQLDNGMMGLCFPLSFLAEDLAGIKQLLTSR